MNLIDPSYSFLQFAAGNSPEAADDILPVVEDTDIKFQTVVEVGDYAEALKLLTADQKLYVVKTGANITDETSLAANTLLTLLNTFSKTQIADTQILLCWTFGLPGISNFADNTCFRLCIRTDNTVSKAYFISNPFIKISDTKYTSAIEYYSDENNYGFDYCSGCMNKVRLELYLGSPQIKETQSVYVFTSGARQGQRKLLDYNAAKQYDLNTNFLSEDIHEKIANALAHDHVNIESSRYTGGIRKDGDYTIEWNDPKETEAPAATKVFSEVYVANNNCAECDEYVNLTCATIDSVNATAVQEPVACAEIASVNASSQKQPGVGALSVSLLRSSNQLTADVTGGTAPYNFHFYCVPVGGSCEDYTISNPNQTNSLGSASTGYSYVLYAGVAYNFYVQVLDAAGNAVVAGPNATAMCLTPDTPILMADGEEKLLDDIRKGDELSDVDLETGEQITTYVTSVNRYIVNKIFLINGELLKASEGHIHIVKGRKDYRLIQSLDLEKGNKLVDRGLSEVTIDSIAVEEGEFEVINISTTTKQYIANGMLTHNKLACP